MNPWQQNEYFWQRTVGLLGAAAAKDYFDAPPQPARGLTVNTRLLGVADFLAAAPFAVAPSGLAADSLRLLAADARPGRHPWHHAGVYYVQEPSAACAAAALHVRPGEKVLDLCAAPGGKSAQLAAALAGQGLLVSNEFDFARSRVLLSNTERLGAPNVLVTNDTPAAVAQVFAGFFDKVLVDAPCSGEGMFRKQPQAVAQHGPALVAHCAALQAEILEAAARCLAPGGELVYSTCTFSPEEDEGQVAAFLARHPEFSLLPTGLAAGCPGHDSHCGGLPLHSEWVRRIYPCHGGEGHFIARLRRLEGAAAPRPDSRKRAARDRDAAQLAPARAFLRENFPTLADAPLAVYGRDIVLPPPVALPSLAGLHPLRCGVLVGSLEVDRAARSPRRPAFVPTHHLLHAFGASATNRELLTAGDPRTAAWLRGEEIAAVTAAPGWCAVCVDGFALGGGKASGARIKNHYPKGLRQLPGASYAGAQALDD